VEKDQDFIAFALSAPNTAPASMSASSCGDWRPLQLGLLRRHFA
jgi:hypothetical protein